VKEVTVQVYDFNELPGITQQQIRNRIMEAKWFEKPIQQEIQNMVSTILQLNGLEDLKEIKYSLNGAGLDGFAFYGYVDLSLFMDMQGLFTKDEFADYEDLIHEFDINVIHKKMHYHNWNSMIVTHDIDYYKDEIKPDIYQDFLGFIKVLEEKLISLSKEATKNGYQIINQYYETNFITDYCKSNNIYFFENGLEYRE
jgi:hypothetical protein